MILLYSRGWVLVKSLIPGGHGKQSVDCVWNVVDPAGQGVHDDAEERLV